MTTKNSGWQQREKENKKTYSNCGQKEIRERERMMREKI
jgi:hypothetical protein